MQGISVNEAVDIVLRHPGNGDILRKEYVIRIMKEQKERLGHTVLLPGAEELLDNLQIVTGANKKPSTCL
jgi:hypothetical protein